MRIIRFTLVFLSIAFFSASCNSSSVSEYDNLPSYGKVKDFNIESFDFSNVKNKVWLFNLFFTSCHGPCPVTMGNLKKVRNKNPDLNIVSVTVDPDTDTRNQLSEYAKEQGISNKNWFLLSTSKENRKKIIEDNFEIQDMDKAKEHSNRVFLIDRKGEIRGAYVGTLSIDIEKLEKDLEALL